MRSRMPLNRPVPPAGRGVTCIVLLATVLANLVLLATVVAIIAIAVRFALGW